MLIEREEPLDRLIDLARRAAEGHGGTVVLGGEAGIGKTALLHEFTQRLGPGHRVLWGGSEALFTPRALGPLQDMAHALGPRMAALLDQAAAPERLFPALLNTLQELPETTVLVFEDVHWADNATLDLVKYLGRRMPVLRTLLVLSYRSDEVGPDHPLRQVLGDLPATAVRIAMQPLSPEAVAALARQGGRPAAELHRITAGNPFFVTELLASQDAAPGSVPASIRDAVWSRLSRLSPEEREALETVSIVPGSVEPWLARALLGGRADAAVDRCIARGMLVRDDQGAIGFRHELARLATLDQLTPAVQQSLHARVETAMAEAPARQAIALLPRQVHHAAAADDGERVLALAPQAAAQASRLGAHHQAAAHLATALRYADQAPKAVAAQLHEDWANEAGLALRIDDTVIEARQHAIALWRELGRMDKVGLNLRALARLLWSRGEVRQAGDCVDEAIRELERLPPGPELAMAYSVRSQLHMQQSHVDEAVEWGRRAMALADRLGDVETRVHALNNVATALLFVDRPGGLEMMEESLALALEHGFREHAARAYMNLAEYAVTFKDFTLAERVLAEGIAYQTRHDLDSWTHYQVGWQARLRLEQGRFREAESIAGGVVGLDLLAPTIRLPALIVLGRVRMRLGEPDAPDLLRQALRHALETGDLHLIAPVRFALAEAAWLAGEPAAAHEPLAAVAAMDLDSFDPWALGELAVWWRRCGMTAPPPAVATARAPAPRAAELAGDPAAAAAEWTRLGLPYEAALALTQVRGGEAGPALARAVAMLEEIEARPAALLARRTAQRLGVADQLPRARRGPYSAARRHPLGLTRRELQVLRLLAQGMGNQDIARRLVRSPRTVEHHVSAVLGKLNASSRMDVVLRLHSEPWLLSAGEN
ncbi:AAA family ATPase [Inquilinus sp. Marseille-Q2685]|uniref:ATP-binding protein n=1 Tax=Inquilinus sp. Marseille-Q2685 TaxID=2866581 RepID=UPI001CE48214|nr:LuxR family transcriptional regulator [Inquilinus sp. Marseille-Q2685]